MARRLRLQFPGARYHVLNRGNLQHDLFTTDGARRSFVRVTGEACAQFGWRLHAYIVMRNHFHLAREHAHLALAPGLAQAEVQELQAERWERALEGALAGCGRTPADLVSSPKSAPWKQALARQLREAVAPSYSWLAEKLTMGQPSSVRVYVHGAGAQPAGTLERGFDRAPGPGPSPAYDPLEFIIAACRQRGLELHAWFNPFRAVSNVNSLASFAPEHIARTRPEWLLAQGSPLPGQGRSAWPRTRVTPP